MCGICGWFSFATPLPSGTLDAMTDALAHRGPDGRGTYISGPVAFGHRRLSIIDLAGGSQPMVSADGGAIITFNGEIFNYRELRSTLGLLDEGVGDTAVLLEGFRSRGPKFLGELNGQYAAAIYEPRLERMTLFRDPRGEKPLFIYQAEDGIGFASEVKSLLVLLRALGRWLEVDVRNLGRYLSLNYVPFGETLISGIRQITPGTQLAIDRSGVRVAATEYARTAIEGDLFAQVLAATKLRLRSDVPLGLFLSSGIDSASVLAAMRAAEVEPRAFIARFDEPGFDESAVAAELCTRLGVAYEVCDVAPSAREIPHLFEAVVRHGDTPLADSSALPVYLLSRQCAQSIKVALSGDGGDELFGGYQTYRATQLAREIPAPIRRIARHAVPLARYCTTFSPGKVGLIEKFERFARSVHLPPGAAHFAWNGMLHRTEVLGLVHPTLHERLDREETFELLARQAKVAFETPSAAQLRNADLCGYLTDDILVKVDRMSMAHGLEVRPIFLDPRLIAYIQSLPESSFGGSKKPLRELLAKSLPEYRPPARKLGFIIPVHRWLRTTLRPLGDELLRSTKFPSHLLNRSAVLDLWRHHQEGRRNLGFELWGILVLLEWLRQTGIE